MKQDYPILQVSKSFAQKILCCCLIAFSFFGSNTINGQSCNTAPVIVCPQNFFGCPSADFATNVSGEATASPGEAGCPQPVITYTEQVMQNGPCNGETIVGRTWRADYPNNANPWLFADCTQMIFLSDNADPSINNCPADISVNMSASCNATVTWNAPTPSDDCQIVSFTSNYSSGDTFPGGTTTVTYTATDICGKTATCSFNVTVSGSCCSGSPSIECLSWYRACPGDDISPASAGTPNASAGNNCDTPIVTYEDEVTNISGCSAYQIVNRYWRATDPNDPSNSTMCGQVIIVGDQEAPIITNCPGDINVDEGDMVSWTEPESSNSCGSITFTPSHSNNTVYSVGCTTVTYTATDACGRSSSCAFQVCVEANQVCAETPVIVCPQNINTCPGASTNVIDTGSATAEPGGALCGIPHISFLDNTSNPFDCTSEQRIQRTWTATDPNNQSLTASCTQIIIHEDNDAPVLNNCPSDIVVTNSSCTGSWTEPTASDNCGIASLTSDYPVGHAFPTGSTLVTYTATDNCGNTATCSFFVSCTPQLVCNNAPVIVCPDQFDGCPADDMSAVNTGFPTAMPGSNQCATPVLTQMDELVTSYGCLGANEIHRTWIATDPSDASLTSSCVQIIIRNDTEAPAIHACPADITITDASCSVSWYEPNATDDCGLLSLVSNIPNGSTFPHGTSTVTYTAIDNCGNSSTCSFNVTCNGQPVCNTAPTIVCPAQYNTCPSASVPGPAAAGSATASAGSSDCSTPVVTYADEFITSLGCTNANKYKRTWTATDPNNSGLNTSCIQIIMLNDSQAPVFSNVPSDLTVNSSSCSATWIAPNVADDCFLQNVTSNYHPGQSVPHGTTTVTYTATDACGNTSSVSFDVTCGTIGNTGDLDVTCPGDVHLTCDNQSGSSTCWDLPTFTTDCSACASGNIPGFIYMGSISGHKYYCSNQPATWAQAKNICQSYGGYLASINSHYENQAIAGFLTIQSAYIGLSDYQQEGNFQWCDGSPVTYNNWYPGQPNNYNGNQDYCELLSNGQWNDVYPHSTIEFIMELPCVTVTQIGGPQNCSTMPVGNTTVTYEVEDLCGNVEICDFDIIVDEGLSLTCVDDVTISCPSHTTGVTVNWEEPMANSCCSVCYGDSGAGDIDGFMYMGSYGGNHYYCSTFPATWPNAQGYCKEFGGDLAIMNSEGENSYIASLLTNVQSAYIGCSDWREEGHFTWVDGSPLTYTNWYPGQPNNYNNAQDYVEILSNGQWNDQYNDKPLEFIMEVDGCVSIKQTAGPENGSYLPLGTTTVTYQATDACGNIENCSFDVTVQGDYCQSGGQQSTHAWIKNVHFGGINNTTGSSGGYADYSAGQCASVVPGYSYSLGLMPGFPSIPANVYWKVYIDWNNDGDFNDSGEFVATGSGAQALSGAITVPSWAPASNTRMRVVMKKGGMPAGSCTVFGYGETEDYCVNVLNGQGIGSGTDSFAKSKTTNGKDKPAQLEIDGFEFVEERAATKIAAFELSVTPNPASEYIQLEMDNIEDVTSMNIYAISGQLIQSWTNDEIVSNNRFEVKSWPAGMYLVKVQFNDGSQAIEKLIKQD